MRPMPLALTPSSQQVIMCANQSACTASRKVRAGCAGTCEHASRYGQQVRSPLRIGAVCQFVLCRAGIAHGPTGRRPRNLGRRRPEGALAPRPWDRSAAAQRAVASISASSPSNPQRSTFS